MSISFDREAKKFYKYVPPDKVYLNSIEDMQYFQVVEKIIYHLPETAKTLVYSCWNCLIDLSR